MVFADPPYVDARPSLYPRSLTTRDHARLAAALRSLDGPWLATYDDHPAVHDLYRGCRIETPTEHSRTGAEVVITPAWLPVGAVHAQPQQTTIYRMFFGAAITHIFPIPTAIVGKLHGGRIFNSTRTVC